MNARVWNRVTQIFVATVVLATIAVPVLADCSPSHAKASTAGSKADIVDTAVAAGDFGTLVAAVKAAGLVDALKGEGPFTVFAPTDEAFAALPTGTVESLLKPENKDQLVAILTYHVVPAKVKAKTAKTLEFGDTLNGQRIDIALKGDNLMIDDANVVAADVMASNGVIHVIDKVILPAQDNLVTTAADAGTFNTLIAAAKAAGLAEALMGDGPLTVFAPTDDAFAKLPKGTVENLLKPENKNQLASILKYHVVAGRVYSDQALKAGRAETLLGDAVTIKVKNGAAKVNNAKLVALDIEASNGVIHVIDTVLLPETDGQASTARGLIEMAIKKGAPLYNHGQPAACAAVYEMTANALIGMDTLPAGEENILRRALRAMDRTHDASDQAWVMRDALDDVYMSLRDMDVSMR